MFKMNLFSKNTETKTQNKSYPEEVLEIHKEFETAADKLLLEANSVIKEAESKDIEKISRLEALGFKKVKQVVEIKPLLQQATLSKEQIELVNYYKREYPFNKFITEDQVKTICHKYNLVCGDVSRFTGFVPEKNLKEIERFKLKEQDKPYIIVKSLRNSLEYALYKEDFTDYGLKHCIGNSFFIVGSEGQDIYDGSILTKECINRFSNKRSLHVVDTGLRNLSLKICAPIKDMDISDLELEGGYKLVKKHIPDPVVLQPVKGGYLILTAWGDEASDPLVVNEINN